jgi:hypothetical protein
VTTLHRLTSLHQSRRRAWVVVGLVGYPAAYAVLLALKETAAPPGLALMAFLLTIAATVIAPGVSYVYARGRFDGRSVRLDEREKHLSMHAYALSHRALAIVLLAAMAAVEIYLTNGNVMIVDAANFLPVMMWVILYVPALPVLMLAWIEPELPEDV